MNIRDTIEYIIYCLSPAQYCQAVFLLLAVGISAVAALPAATRRHLLDYGARESKATAAKAGEPGTFECLVATLAAHSQVPHAWFSSFYVIYLVCAACWTAQWLLWRLDWPASGLFSWLLERQLYGRAASMTMPQVYATCGLMAIQAGRRLYEQTYVFKPSKSKMNITHCVLGLAFYICISMAVWIEGAGAIVVTKDSIVHAYGADKIAWMHIVVGATVFLEASLEQSDCHKYLASLEKYSLPEKGKFQTIVCPHYTCEIKIYLALAIVAAPPGYWSSQTFVAASIFVTVCLGVTASRTKTWYIEKFGQEQVAKKWKMIPFIF